MSAERYLTKEKAAVEVYGKNGNAIVSLRNLSQTGALLEWPEQDFQLNKGDLIRMTVILKKLNRRHKLNAEVVWSQGHEVGVQFISSQQVLEKMVDKSG